MALIERLAGINEHLSPDDHGKLSVDTFWAMLFEMAQGQKTKAEIVAYFALDADEQVELDWLIGRYNAQPTATAKSRFVELMRVIFILAESGVSGYTTNAAIVARIDAIQ